MFADALRTIPPPPDDARRKVLVAMSGGVDSSVAAALLAEKGYEVVGCFMRLGSPGESLDELIPGDQALACDPAAPGKGIRIGKQGCCSVGDAADARQVAAQLGVSFYVCNFKKDFGRIIDYFGAEYAAGRTPNPCVRCNDWLKFGKLHDYAKQIGAAFVASGHYARVEACGDGFELRRGVDTGKDQSYVLFGVPPERMSHMLLPIGRFTKPEIRAMAEELGLPVFDKPDSQEICFVPDNDYAGLIERRNPGLARPGAIVDTSGKTVGEHEGQHRFTIGQRRGVGVALGYPIYVVDKDPRTNTVTVGSEADLLSDALVAHEANWLVGVNERAAMRSWTPCEARIRYNAAAVPARVRLLDDADGSGTPSGRPGRFEVRFDEPQRAVAPGQACVIYSRDDADRVLGGGWIASAGSGDLVATERSRTGRGTDATNDTADSDEARGGAGAGSVG